MAHSAIMHDNGKLTIPPDILEELDWQVGDPLAIERSESGVVVRRQSDDKPRV